ncbi:DNA cytosine methyltransferase [Euzebya rosea]|uniref:DNA cytosine methyltransferase n=1 Tax=Euzebya rosea TaxID=2052804 RepID=UPI000D3EDA84|nr:DNA cytosine methyltransferase [Euzebya rosea]
MIDQDDSQVLSRPPVAAAESFFAAGGSLYRRLLRADGTVTSSLVASPHAGQASLPDGPVTPDTADRLYLQRRSAPTVDRSSPALHAVDLFCGVGGLSEGLAEAARAVGRQLHVALAVDSNDEMARAFRRNRSEARTFVGDVRTLLDSELDSPLSSRERQLRAELGSIDFLVGGPPCQGHSAFNNRTRHADSRNALYTVMARAAQVLQPTHVIIENVPGATSDRSDVVRRTTDSLVQAGYEIDEGVVDVTDLGVAQRRRRFVVVASRLERPSLARTVAAHRRPTRSVGWAIGDLDGQAPDSLLDQQARSAGATRRRIDYLFRNNLHDLPNEQRPACHQGSHSYKSVYGRMHLDRPAQTITRGFYSMCMGRYVHPTRRRTITAHEAARLQHFPDSFDWSEITSRGALALAVANAVPPRLSYSVAVELLR